MADKRIQTFKVIGDEPCMGYVHGEQFTVVDLDREREEEYLRDGSLEFVSGDKPHTPRKTPTTQQSGQTTPKGQQS